MPVHILKIDPQILADYQKTHEFLIYAGDYDLAYAVLIKMADYIYRSLEKNNS